MHGAGKPGQSGVLPPNPVSIEGMNRKSSGSGSAKHAAMSLRIAPILVNPPWGTEEKMIGADGAGRCQGPLDAGSAAGWSLLAVERLPRRSDMLPMPHGAEPKRHDGAWSTAVSVRSARFGRVATPP